MCESPFIHSTESGLVGCGQGGSSLGPRGTVEVGRMSEWPHGLWLVLWKGTEQGVGVEASAQGGEG